MRYAKTWNFLSSDKYTACSVMRITSRTGKQGTFELDLLVVGTEDYVDEQVNAWLQQGGAAEGGLLYEKATYEDFKKYAAEMLDADQLEGTW